MKTLYLVRHAKSSWNYPELSDFERPLNKRGNHDAPLMGKLLKEKSIKPDRMVTSPATRALITARYVAMNLNYQLEKISIDERLYDAGQNDILEVIGEVGSKVNNLMIFGHNPGLTYVANSLCEEYIDNIVTAAVYSINFETESWTSISNKNSSFNFYEYPKKYY